MSCRPLTFLEISVLVDGWEEIEDLEFTVCYIHRTLREFPLVDTCGRFEGSKLDNVTGEVSISNFFLSFLNCFGSASELSGGFCSLS